MNSNRVIVRSPFIAFLLVSALLSVTLPAYVWYSQGLQKATPLLVAGACYFVGVFLVTMLSNVPLNNRLAALSEGVNRFLEFNAGKAGGFNDWAPGKEKDVTGLILLGHTYAAEGEIAWKQTRIQA